MRLTLAPEQAADFSRCLCDPEQGGQSRGECLDLAHMLHLLPCPQRQFPAAISKIASNSGFPSIARGLAKKAFALASSPSMETSPISKALRIRSTAGVAESMISCACQKSRQRIVKTGPSETAAAGWKAFAVLSHLRSVVLPARMSIVVAFLVVVENLPTGSATTTDPVGVRGLSPQTPGTGSPRAKLQKSLLCRSCLRCNSTLRSSTGSQLRH